MSTRRGVIHIEGDAGQQVVGLWVTAVTDGQVLLDLVVLSLLVCIGDEANVRILRTELKGSL